MQEVIYVIYDIVIARECFEIFQALNELIQGILQKAGQKNFAFCMIFAPDVSPVKNTEA